MCAAVTTGQAAYYERLREACRSPQKRAEFGAKAHAWAVASRVRGQQRQGFLDTPERLNESGHCRAQLTQRLKELQARYDGVPTDDQLIQNGLSPSSICLAFHLPTITEVIKLLELTPSLERIGQGVRGYTREYLIEVLRDFWAKYGTLPSRSHERMGMVPRGGAFVRVFGSMKAAYEAAGLARVSGRSPYTRESLIQQMRDFYRAYGHGPRLSRKHGNGTGGGLPPGFPSHRIWKRFFGSMAAAREAAGIESGQ
jgi:hypothetical protein